VDAKLKKQIIRATDKVWQKMEKYGVNMRTAAYIVAIKKLVEAMKVRGI